MHDAVIIGGGLGGLETGVFLSERGMKVLVLERCRQLGGALQSYRRGSRTYDTGFHYVGGLGKGERLEAVFRGLGLMELPWRKMDDQFDIVHVGSRHIPISQGWDSFVDGLASQFPSERDAISAYAELLKRCCLGSDLQLMDINAHQYLTSHFRDPMLIDAISGASIRMELRKESLPLLAFIENNSGYVESSWRLAGDGSMIAELLAQKIRKNGGQTVCSTDIVRLEEKDGLIRSATSADGRVFRGGIFISDIHPEQTMRMVSQSGRPVTSFLRRLKNLENTFGMFTVSLQLKPGALEYFGCNHYVYLHPDVWSLSERIDDEVAGVMVSCRVPMDGSPYASQVDILTPTHWGRWDPWSDTAVGRRGTSYIQLKDRMADDCIALAEHALPGLRGMVSERYTSSPLTYRDYTRTPLGSAYGIRKDCRKPLLTMLSPRTPIPNLYLTGQNLMLHGVCGVTMTALNTINEILNREI